MTLIDQIRDLIAEGETQRSLDELYKYVKESNADVIDNLVMLRSRMQNVQRAVGNGTMDDQTAALERAKINEAILKLLPQLTPEYLAEASKRKEPIHSAAMPQTAASSPAAASGPNMKMIYMIGGGLLALVLLILAIRGCGGGSEEEQYVATETELAEETSWSPPEGTLLYDVMADHSGYAVWKSAYSEVNGQSIFRMDDDTNWQEIKNGQVVGTFEMLTNSDTYVTLHDSERKMFVRLSATNAEYHTEDDPSWYVLFDGEWITPPDAR